MKSELRVALFKDIFWNNNSESYPTTIPTLDLFNVYDQQIEPVFISPYEAWIILEGDYNLAFYEGNYYQLKKIRLDDKYRNIIKYQMIYDVMLNFLKIGGTVQGNVIRTNKTEWLEDPEAAQTCVPFLENPASCIFGTFSEETFNWKKNCKITYRNEKFESHSFTEDSVNLFINHVKNDDYIKEIRNKSFLALSGEVFIYSYLPTVKVSSWKNNVIDLIKEDLSDLSKYTIATASQLGDSKLKTHKCLTHIDAAIGTSESSNIGIKSIDLSGLKDIVPITLGLDLDKPHQKIDLSVLYPDKVWHPNIPHEFIRKFSRVTHLPYRNKYSPVDEEALLPLYGSDYSFYLQGKNNTNYNSAVPQKLKFKEAVNITSHIGYLWKVDKLDFTFVSTVKENNQDQIKYPGLWEGSRAFFKDIPRDNLPSIGFLIFEPLKTRFNFKDNKYISDTTLKEIPIRTGINRELINKYGDSRNKWWGNIDPSLARIRGAQELSFHALETDLFSWLYFAPKTAGGNYDYSYRWYDDWGVQKFLGRNTYYVHELVTADIPGRSEPNPYNPNRIINWLSKREELIGNISIFEKIKLDYPIKKNDIFTTSLNTVITANKPLEDRTALISGLQAAAGVGGAAAVGGLAATLASGPAAPIVATISVLAGIAAASATASNLKKLDELAYKWQGEAILLDLFKASWQPSDMMNNTLVLYSENNNLQLGIYREYKKEIKLSDSSEQIIDTVDGQKSKLVTFYHIQNIPYELTKGFIEGEVTPEQKNFIISHALEAIGLGRSGSMYMFTKETLKNTTQLFDLEGTDWYAYFKSGHVHLISKTEKDFFKTEQKYHSIQFNTNHTLSLLEKLNQQAVISIYGNSKPLATKFLLTKDEFDLHTEIFDIRDKNTSTDYIQVICENPHDYINEIVQIPKKTLQATASISIAELETLKHQIRVNNEKEYLDKAINKNLYDQQMRYFQRQREDRGLQIASEVMGAVGSGLSVAAMGGLPLAIAGPSNIATTLFRPGLDNIDLPKTILARHSFWTGRYGSGLAMGLGRFAQSIPTVIGSAWEFGRIKEDEKAFMERNSFEVMQRNNKYTSDYKRSLMELNRTSTSYVARDVNDRDILDKLKEQGKPEIHLQLYTPTPLQLKKAQAIFDLFGIECYIPNKEIIVTSGMDPQTIQFDILSSDSISSEITTDSFIRDHIEFLFTQGIIFVKHNYIPIHPKSIEIFLPKGEKFDFDISKITEWTSEEWDRYIVSAPANKINEVLKKLPHFGLTDQEYEQYKDELDPNNLLEGINKIVSNRGSGLAITIRPKTKHEQELEEQVKALDVCKTDKEELTKQRDKLQIDLKSATNRANQLSIFAHDKETEVQKYKNLYNLEKDQVNNLKREKAELQNVNKGLLDQLEQANSNIPDPNAIIFNSQSYLDTYALIAGAANNLFTVRYEDHSKRYIYYFQNYAFLLQNGYKFDYSAKFPGYAKTNWEGSMRPTSFIDTIDDIIQSRKSLYESWSKYSDKILDLWQKIISHPQESGYVVLYLNKSELYSSQMDEAWVNRTVKQTYDTYLLIDSFFLELAKIKKELIKHNEDYSHISHVQTQMIGDSYTNVPKTHAAILVFYGTWLGANGNGYDYYYYVNTNDNYKYTTQAKRLWKKNPNWFV